MLVRRPAVSGSFYPASKPELSRLIDRLLDEARQPNFAGPAPKVLVAPHAGYIYSGPIAASAFARITTPIERVVLIGPAHRVFVRGMVSPGADRLETPLGEIEVDREALARVPDVVANAEAHADEHSLEVELPFIQTIAPNARVVPIAVSHANASDVGQALEALWGGPETLIVISSDLSHYHPYADGRARDQRSVAKILALDPTLVGEDACGCTGLNGLAWVAQRKQLRGELIDLRSSGDTAGSRDAVVGYAAIAFSEAA
jgi:AmmeMemoRadiSam system protein B